MARIKLYSVQVTGSWHTFKLAATDPSVVEEGDAYRCFMTGIVLLDNGTLNVTYLHRYFGMERPLTRFCGDTFSLPPPRSSVTQGSDPEKTLMILILWAAP